MGGFEMSSKTGQEQDPPQRKRRRFSVRRLRLTGEGRVFIAIAVGVGLAAINTGNNLLYLLLGWLLSVIIASGILSELTLRRLVISRRITGPVYANRPFTVEVSLQNTKRRATTYAIEAIDISNANKIDKSSFFLKVKANQTARMSYRHSVPKRGVYHFDGFCIQTKFPFSLFRKARYLHQPSEIVVYPAVYPLPPPSPQTRKIGDKLLSRVGRRGEFFGLREYRDGDDPRDIHWRSTARTGRLTVREYEQEAHKKASIVLDNALPLPTTRETRQALEDAISLAASLAKTYAQLGYTVELIARGLHLPHSAGPSQVIRILKALALLETVTEEVPFSSLLHPQDNSVLVAPRGIQARGRPTQASIILEAS